ncbi:MAG: hypothetical protein M4579_006152 [Chaenotheca gracillima]|nr:MAG: hypothetical protein M4579_006152 [Chaenotheca gracillima]
MVHTVLLESCIDVQHKKRGRPRLRDERETRLETTQPGLSPRQSMRAPPTTTLFSPRDAAHHHPAGAYRALRAQSEASSPNQRQGFGYGHVSDLNTAPASTRTSHALGPPFPYATPSHNVAAAFLNMNMVIERTTPLFRASLGYNVELAGRELSDLLARPEQDKIARIQRHLEEERKSRDPEYLPPIYGGSEAEAIRRVPEGDIERVSGGSTVRREEFTMRHPNGRLQTYPVLIRLAKANVYFVVITLLQAENANSSQYAEFQQSTAYRGSAEQSMPSPRMVLSPLSPRPGPFRPAFPLSRAASNPTSPFYAHPPSLVQTPLGRGEPHFSSQSEYLPVPASLPSASPYHVALTPPAPQITQPPPRRQSATGEIGAQGGPFRGRPESLQLPPLRGESTNSPRAIQSELKSERAPAGGEREVQQGMHPESQQREEVGSTAVSQAQRRRRQRSESPSDEPGGETQKRRKFTVEGMLE